MMPFLQLRLIPNERRKREAEGGGLQGEEGGRSGKSGHTSIKRKCTVNVALGPLTSHAHTHTVGKKGRREGDRGKVYGGRNGGIGTPGSLSCLALVHRKRRSDVTSASAVAVAAAAAVAAGVVRASPLALPLVSCAREEGERRCEVREHTSCRRSCCRRQPLPSSSSLPVRSLSPLVPVCVCASQAAA